jgi:putative Holliday junction resolvase
MKLLALDVGERRIGVAVSDPLGLIASPLAVVERASKVEDFAEIGRLARENEAGALIVGHPLDEDGQAGPQARYVERYTATLEAALHDQGLDLPVIFWDERMSTRRAEEAMIVSGRRARERRARIDAVAAAVILQDYLDAQRPPTVPPP